MSPANCSSANTRVRDCGCWCSAAATCPGVLGPCSYRCASTLNLFALNAPCWRSMRSRRPRRTTARRRDAATAPRWPPRPRPQLLRYHVINHLLAVSGRRLFVRKFAASSTRSRMGMDYLADPIQAIRRRSRRPIANEGHERSAVQLIPKVPPLHRRPSTGLRGPPMGFRPSRYAYFAVTLDKTGVPARPSTPDVALPDFSPRMVGRRRRPRPQGVRTAAGIIAMALTAGLGLAACGGGHSGLAVASRSSPSSAQPVSSSSGSSGSNS